MGEINSASFGPYKQIILFGDSLTEFSANQDGGFAFMPALQDCKSK
jgi:isoamyl acetate esterase